MVKQNPRKSDLKKQREMIAELMKQAKEIHKQNLANFEQILTPKQKSHFQKIKKQNISNIKTMTK